MCGFVLTSGDADEAIVQGMMDRIKHRGPDGSGLCAWGMLSLVMCVWPSSIWPVAHNR